MQKFGGGFVWADESTSLIIDPTTSKSGGRIAGKPEIESLDIDATEWLIPLSVVKENRDEVVGGFGMHPEAIELKDLYDEMSLPRFYKYTDLYTMHENYFYPWFATDVVPTTTNHMWSFTLSSNETEQTQLRWDHNALDQKNSNLYLLDKQLGKVIDMKLQGSYNVTMTEGDFEFEIYYVAVGEIFNPADLVFGAAYPNPASDVVTFPVVIPGHLANQEMELDLFNINGQKVFTVAKGRYEAGAYEFTWQIPDQNMSGLYIYRVTFGSSTSSALYKKLIIR
jgi:hypothetical protein